MSTTLLEPVLIGQKWVRLGGQHEGVEVRVLSADGNTVAVRVLPSPGARNWNKGKSGQVWRIGRHLFGTAYRLVRESGGGSVHDAPLPPAAIRREMTIEDAVTQAIEEHKPAEVVSNGIAEYENFDPYEGMPERVVPYEKICSSCGQVKVAEENFYHSSASKDGFHTWCKICQDANRKQNYLKKKAARSEDERVANLKEAMGTDRVRAAIRAGVIKKVEALSAEQKAEIIALWQSKANPQEIQKAYGLNGAMYRMVLDEYRESIRPALEATPDEVARIADALDAQEVTPGTPAAPPKSFTVTYTVLRPVEVTEVVEARYMTGAINAVGARDGVQEIVSVVLNKSEGK